MIATGFGLSFSALLAIGVDATYFGIELGKLEYKDAWVVSFPYSLMKHPMIVGNVVGLLGIMKVVGDGWLVPAHIGLYVLHMLQEHYQVYKRVEVKID
jgi:protein-S-isoprenylcysteine O-methyltransferase Ste14